MSNSVEMLLDNRTKAELSEIVDGDICGSGISEWDSCGDFEEEILSEIESSRELSNQEYAYCEQLCREYWSDHIENNNEDDDEDDD